VLSVKLIDQLLGIFEVLCWFPTRAYVAVFGPLDEVMELPISPFGVENAIDFPFFLSRFVDNRRLRLRWRLTYNRGGASIKM
jgi:hypothetical protein